jgi:hypothetical protein
VVYIGAFALMLNKLHRDNIRLIKLNALPFSVLSTSVARDSFTISSILHTEND